ncbi:hypothetical protein Tco_1505585 [Tanacetum coccineum]
MSVSGCSLVNQGFIPRTELSNPIDLFNALAFTINKAINGYIVKGVKQQPNGIFISQDKYVADILKKFDFCSIKTATTPIVSNKPLVKDEDGVDVDVWYQIFTKGQKRS